MVRVWLRRGSNGISREFAVRGLFADNRVWSKARETLADKSPRGVQGEAIMETAGMGSCRSRERPGVSILAGAFAKA